MWSFIKKYFRNAESPLLMSQDEKNHFYVGSDCMITNPEQIYPNKVLAASDIITITRDIGNEIPNGSWMLYLLEFLLTEHH